MESSCPWIQVRVNLAWPKWLLAGSPTFRRKGINLFYRRQHHHHMCWKPVKSCFFPFYDQDILDKGWDPNISHFNTGGYPQKKYVHCPYFTDSWVAANGSPLWSALWIKHKIDFTFRIVHYGTFHIRNTSLLRPHVLKLKSPCLSSDYRSQGGSSI